MKISELENEKALNLYIEIIDPVIAILNDKELAEECRNKKFLDACKAGNYAAMLRAAKIVLKNHGSEAIAVLAAMDGVSVDDFHCGVLDLPKKIIAAYKYFASDPDLISFFSSAAPKNTEMSFGEASESTSGNGQ